MDISLLSTKDVGNLGERVVAEYLRRKDFRIVARNVARKTGEIDIIAQKDATLHFVEVKSVVCKDLPSSKEVKDMYDPSGNLHEVKIRKVARTSEWYVAEKGWEGEWQIDGALVWLRKHDGMARVAYLPQIL